MAALRKESELAQIVCDKSEAELNELVNRLTQELAQMQRTLAQWQQKP